MGFRNGSYATVWQVDGMSPSMTKVRLSISKKNKDGIYEQDFGSKHIRQSRRGLPSIHLRRGAVDLVIRFQNDGSLRTL